VVVDGSGLLRGVVVDGSGLLRGVVVDGSGLLRRRLLYLIYCLWTENVFCVSAVISLNSCKSLEHVYLIKVTSLFTTLFTYKINKNIFISPFHLCFTSVRPRYFSANFSQQLLMAEI
jgi:hypothetical protein